MTMHIKFVIAICAMLLALAQPSYADNFANGLQAPLDWQTTWGGINFSGGTDPIIPNAQLQPKEDIKNITSSYGTQTSDLSSIAAYTLDLNGDGKDDYILDGKGYFTQYQKPQATLQICTAEDGCYLSIYIKGEDTNLISAPAKGDPSCPASAALNTACIASCAATEQNCPALFQYNTHTAFDEQVIKWNFIGADAFKSWAHDKSYTIYNDSPVFVAQRNNTNCYNDEMANNNNTCIKYYQYFGDANTGTFLDLYSYNGNLNANGDYNPRWTYNSFDIRNVAEGGSYAWDDSANKKLAPPQPGDNVNYGTGYGLKLTHGGSIDLQFAQFEFTDTIQSTTFGFNGQNGYPNKPNFASFHIENHSNHDYFVPVNTNKEFRAFVDSHQPGVSCGPERLQFTAWTGDLTCPAKVTAPLTIAAQRFCQSSTSDYRPCQACIDAKVPGYEQGCTATQDCQVNACLVDFTGSQPSDLPRYTGTYVTLNECYSQLQPYIGQVLTTNVGTYPNNYWPGTFAWANIGRNQFAGPISLDKCQPAFDYVCSYGHMCVADETKVSLPDGTTKAIVDIKPGDMVLGFVNPKDALKPVKVKTLAVTEKQDMLEINGSLKLTPVHKVVTAKGYLTPASRLKVGDFLLKDDSTTLKIEKIEPVTATDTVYNLVLDGATGFVADGIRVDGYQ